MFKNKRGCKTDKPFNTVDEKGSDIDHLSHELRTPLHVIQGSIEMLKSFPTRLCELRKLTSSSPVELIKNLSHQAHTLKSELEIIQKNITQLNLFLKNENASRFDQLTQKLKL